MGVWRLQVRGKWTEAVASLAHEAAMALSPSAVAAHGVNDPRLYVKVLRYLTTLSAAHLLI